ncbi:MAG: aminotransferase [Candidatus Heimdallarchaeota archaeon]|nr:aminotransferase [Candidatus Heimdallarchaeota archaeon]
MKVDDFLVERFMSKYEQDVELNLAETCVDPFTLNQLFALTDTEDFFDQINDTQLTYGYIEGSDDIRKGLADLYKNQDAENVLISSGAIGGNFLIFYSLVEPGDTVISIFPAYQQLYSTPKSFGANVKLLKLKPEDGWLPNIDELKKLIDDKTKLIVINNPHNPTGAMIETPLLQQICDIANEAGAYVLCDEVYRGLYINSNDKVSSVVDLYDKAIVTGSFSKSFSLAGIRLGWIVANKDIIGKFMLRRDYTTISNGMIDDAVGALATKHVDQIFERNLKIVRINHQIVSEWVENEPLIDWVAPRAGSVAFLKHNLNVSSEEICVDLIKEKSTFMVPGNCFNMEGYIRLGYGCKTEVLKEGLTRFKEFLEKFR